MAEQAVDKVGQHLGAKISPCRTAKEPLLPAAEVTPYSGILPAPFTREAVEHYVRREWALHLSDIMLRRSGWHYYDRDTTARARQVAAWMATAAGWSNARQAAELEAWTGSCRREAAQSA
jgi:glycerol-3-phosphate dehydrogenase